MQLFRQLFATIATKDIILILRQFGRREPSHILDKTQYGHIDFLVAEHIHPLACISQCDGLRCCNNNSSGQLQGLYQRQVDITCSGRQVD